jgi:hypothetical protein
MPSLLAARPKVEISSVEGARIMTTWVQLRADKRVAVRVESTARYSELVVNTGRCEVATSSCKWVEMLGVVTAPVQWY